MATTLAASLLAVTPGSSAAGRETSEECRAPGELTAGDERAAFALAADCDRPVEIEAGRDHAERQYAEPDGTITLETYATPQWARSSSGDWVDADPTLVTDDTGAITTTAGVVEIVVSPGGTGPLVRASDRAGRTLAVTWPTALPAPTLDGATATYPAVFDGIDLQVTAGIEHFSYALVVQSADAAAAAAADLSTIDVKLAGDGLELSQGESGEVVAVDPGGERIFSAAGAQMWDSSTPASRLESGVLSLAGVPTGAGDVMLRGNDIPDAEPGRIATMPVELTGDTLRVSPDQEMLADPTTEYPVTIDPTFTATRTAWATVGNGQYASTTWWDDAAWPRSDGLRVGFMGWGAAGSTGYARWRSLARFDTQALYGSTINSASVRLTVFHTGGCANAPLQLWEARQITQGHVPTTWNSTNSGFASNLETRSVPSANSTGDFCSPQPNRNVTFSAATIRQLLQANADARTGSVTFGLRAGDEGDMMQWMRAYADSFALTVNYTPVVAVPSGLAFDDIGCLDPEGSRVAGSAPVLSGVPRNSEGTATARIELRTATGTSNLRTWTSATVTTGHPVEWQVAEPLPDGEYRWRMRSQSPGSGGVSDWTGWCEFTVDVTLDQDAAPAAAAELACPFEAGEPMEAATESLALLAAQACDAPVEALSERDFAARVYGQPDGTFLAEQYAEPQWAQDSDGDWTEVDTGLTVHPDGRISSAAAVSEIEVSPGGTGPLVTATDPDGGSMSLTWPDALPAPVLDGATATYPEVFDDVDLRVTAGVDGFSYVLVVKSAAAAADPALASVSVAIDGDGLDVLQDSDGTVILRDPAGETVYSAPVAQMWDSSTPDSGAAPAATMMAGEEEGSGEPGDVIPGRFTDMPLELVGDQLTVEPDQALLTDPDVVFPVMIDPPFSGKRLHWATIHQQQASRGWSDDSSWPRQGGMRIGYLTDWPGQACGSACGLWRSVVRFDTRDIRNKQIISAAVKLVQTHTSGCGSYGLQLWSVDSFTSGTSWNGMSSKWNSNLQSQTVSSSNTGSCVQARRGVTYSNSSVRSRVQQNANAGTTSISFGLRSSSESDRNAYRRVEVKSLKLEVEYNNPAQIPTNLNTDGRGCASSSPGPWITTQRPTLSGVPRDPDGRTGAHLQIRRIGSSSTHYSWQTPTNRTHNTVVNHRIPANKGLNSGNYRWRMRSLDSHPQGTHSAWREWCYFRVDVTSPTTPTVEVVGDVPAAGGEVTLRFRSSDAHSGMHSFHYGINEEVKRTPVSSTSGNTTIKFRTPAAGGRQWIYVWSRDQAGNYSNRAVFDFFSAKFVEAVPAAAWRLDGDGVDDTGLRDDAASPPRNNLHLGNGVSWQAGDGVVADTALGFDGTGCVSTAGEVVRTDAEYTVAAWVRIDDASKRMSILGTAGDNRMGFYLRYREGNERWQFLLFDSDRTDGAWAGLLSAEPAVVGQWTHIAVRMDPAARRVEMYVNGEFSSERTISWVAWHTDGPLYLGCTGLTNGATSDELRGAVHHVGVWQGLLTPEQVRAASLGDFPAGVTGDWHLRAESPGSDASAHARSLTVPDFTTWVDDQYGRQRSAIRFNGNQSAESDGPILKTNQPFSAAAWVKLDNKTAARTVLAQTGAHVPAVDLAYDPGPDRWRFRMASRDASSGVTWHAVHSTAAPAVGEWYHLAAVHDRAAGQMRLYVNGTLASTGTAPSQPWYAAGGRFLVGATGHGDARADRMAGTVSDVKTWRGALTAAQVAHVHGGNPAVKELARWNLSGNSRDQVGASDLALTGVQGVDYDWTEDRSCFPWRALGLEVTGDAYGQTAGPVVDTDESFTITVWAKPTSLTSGQTVLSQAGQHVPGVALRATPNGTWQFAVSERDAANSPVVVAESPAGLAQVDEWTHLAGTFDLANGKVRLYVNGAMVAESNAVQAPWQAPGPFFVGAAGRTSEPRTSSHFHGVIDSIAVFRSVLDPDRIRDAGGPVPGGWSPCFPADLTSF